MSSFAPSDLPTSATTGNVDGAWASPYAAFRPRGWQVAVAVAVFVWLLVDVLLSGPLRGLDRQIAPALLDLGMREHSSLRHLGFALSQAGGRGTNLIWIAVLCAVVLYRHRTFAPFVKALSATGVMFVAVYPFKEWLSRSYPADPRGDYLHAAGDLGGAFPSGHQANATLLASVGAWIAFEHIRAVWVRRVIGAYALAAPFVSAIAVLLMGYHWLTDVVAGTCAGVVLLAFIRWVWATPVGLRVEAALSLRRG